jgi:tRNA (uracil-5-)-methyltransferase TRM9
MESVRSLIRPLRLIPPTVSSGESHTRCSRFLIYVWAFEQGENSKRKMGVLASATPVLQADQKEETGHNATDKDSVAETTSKEGTIAQDVMVPWVLQPKVQPKSKIPKKQAKKPRGPRGNGATNTVPATVATGTDKHETTNPSETTTSAMKESGQADQLKPAAPQVFHRYYHLFVKGELRDLVSDAGRAEGFTIVQQQPTEAENSQASSLPRHASAPEQRKWLRVVEEGYEKDNWWLEGEVGLHTS